MVACCSFSHNTQASIPIFKGDNYNLWSLKMRTMFRSRRLWTLVEKRLAEDEDEGRNNDAVKRDAKALYLIQQVLEERILIRITTASTAKEAWDILKTEFQGNSETISVKVHALQQELTEMKMRHQGENVQSYITRVLDIMFQIRMLDENVPEKVIVSKIRRSLALRFQHVVTSIIAARNLNSITVEELRSSLKTHEAILALNSGQEEEKDFHVKPGGQEGKGLGTTS